MTGLQVGLFWYEIGSPDFFHSFFSTIAFNLENKEWGSKYPLIQKDLFGGKLSNSQIEKAKNELITIQKKLKKYPPNSIVWDIDDLSKTPPWGNAISDDITNLSNYFVSSNGEDLFEVLFEALNTAIEEQEDITIKTL